MASRADLRAERQEQGKITRGELKRVLQRYDDTGLGAIDRLNIPDALVDIGFGDDKAVHDRCRNTAIGVAVLQHGEIARQAEQVTLGHRLLRLARDRCGSEAGSGGHRKQSGNRFCSHVSNLSCGIALMPEYATRNAGARLNQS